MENRITNLLLPLIVVVLGFILFKDFFSPPKEDQEEARSEGRVVSFEGDAEEQLPHIVEKGENKLYTYTVGELGKPGFKLVFSPRGGSIYRARLLDVYKTAGLDADARRKEENLYEVIDPFLDESGSAYNSFNQRVLQGRNLVWDPQQKRAIQLKDAHWERVVEGGLAPDEGVRYRLTLSNGLIWEKDFRFQKGSREIRLQIRLRNTKGVEQEYKYLKDALYAAQVLPHLTRAQT